jgi:hypothetical protein
MDLSIRPSGRGTEEQPQARGAEPHRDRSASSTATGAGLACLGQASTSSFAGFSAGFTNGAQTFSGLFGGGSDHYLSVGTVSYTDYTDLDASAWTWGGLFGGDLMPRGQIVHACPLGGVFYTHLMDSDFNEFDIVGGGSLGIVALDTAAVGVIPYFSATYTRAIVLDEDLSLNAGAIGIGVGLVFQRRITLRPSVVFPLNMPDTDPTFQVALTMGFGR